MISLRTPLRLVILAQALVPVLLFAQPGFPFQDEGLRYTVNWASGLSLGDVNLSAHHNPKGWTFDASLDAAIPGFTIADKYHSSVNKDLCSLELDRNISHGGKKSHEKTTFDQDKHTAKRVTLFPEGGGHSDIDTPSCARDALAFLYYARQELGQGRVAPTQQVFLGSAYSARIDYTGAMTIPVAEKATETDHVTVSVKGPKSDFTFDIFFAKDAARTPLLIKVPLKLGTLSMELVR